MPGQLVEQRPLVGVVRQQQLDLAEPVALPPAQPDQERHGPGRRREPGRLRVEADQRRVRRAAGRAAPASRSRSTGMVDGRRLAPDDRPLRGLDDLAVQRRREPLRQVGPAIGRAAERIGSSAGAIGADRGPERARARRARFDERAARAVTRRPVTAPAPAPAPSSREQPQGERACASTSGSSRGPVQAGQPPSQPHARDQRRPRRRAARRGAPTAAPTGPTRPGTASYR